MGSKVVEEWINNSLRDAENTSIPGVMRHPHKVQPLISFGIDRHTMMNAGVSSQKCDSLYRALYVYTVGFFENIKQNISINISEIESLKLTKAIWRVF